MNRRQRPLAWILLCGLATPVSWAGCGRSTSDKPVPGPVKPTPEESFNVIISTFKRRVEGASGGFIAPKGNGHSRLIASNSVTSELIPPAKEGETYRATITVTSRSRYSLRRGTDESDASQRGDASSQQSSSSGALDDPGGIQTGVEILDPGLVNPAPGEGAAQHVPSGSDGTVLRRPDEEEQQIFDLEYRNGRWQLLTNPDPDTQRAIRSAFDEALATQI